MGKQIKLSPTLVAELKQRERFIKKFGRPPGPDDPMIFDPESSTPQPLDLDKTVAALTKAAAAAGVDGALIRYA